MATQQTAHQELHGTRLTARAVYQAIRRDGEDELQRPFGSLWWSGLAAGIVISASVFAKGLLHLELPDTAWRPLLENFGYCVGFLIVVLGRMQLFTENTITVVLPLMAERTSRVFYYTLRLWLVVFAANLAGTLIAVLFAYFGFATPEQLDSFRAVSRPLMEKSWIEMLVHGIPAGFFVAAMVWMLPNSRSFEIWVVVLMTYLIVLGDFAHVVVGSAEAWLLLLAGEIGAFKALWGFLVPAFIGNVIGGTALFSLLAYAQVRQEIE